MSKKHSAILNSPLPLPCGARIKNRLCKSAMSENLASVHHSPTNFLTNLYGKWADGGIGLCITGNIMIDSNALGEPRNVVVEDESIMDELRSWAVSGTQNNTHLWAQLNHPGKQSPNTLSEQPVAPSAIAFSGGLQKFFNPPRELQESEIKDLIQRFANAAGILKKAGFTGVQIHGAHGYLVSQFLSSNHNQRTDDWGGSAENRMRFVLEIYRAIRKTVGEKFPVGVKLNSSDFMLGGFTEDESIAVATALTNEGIDLIEISGGTYERPAMTGRTGKQKVRASEAYFLSYAEKIRSQVQTPLMITGGFRTSGGMADAVAGKHIDLVGLARSMAVDPELPNKVLSGEDYVSSVKPLTTGIKLLDKMALMEVTWYEQQLAYIAKGKDPKPNQGIWFSLAKTMMTTGFQVFQKRRA
ncbi:MAG: NADH:flavin oxidoreductase/NADH oxidase family protein [Desulfobacteraceae bacterium]|jgi:2,4-dienoyl-CoA reductase-like NADH-dependent reductase (Old Yellow Enzyme family)|nr:NADH:flavin oxidoreductase/NADH oxidase family protein [Desulfobacteraceae bacterium]